MSTPLLVCELLSGSEDYVLVPITITALSAETSERLNEAEYVRGILGLEQITRRAS